MKLLEILAKLFGATKAVNAGGRERDELMAASNFGNFTILVAGLANDNNGDVANYVLGSISSGWPGIEVIAYPEVLRLQPANNIWQSFQIAVDQGREWLIHEKADLLIWGEIGDGFVRLRFLTPYLETEPRPGAFSLFDRLELPLEYSRSLAEVIYAITIAAPLAKNEAQFNRQRSLMAAIMLPLDMMLQNPAAVPPLTQASLAIVYANLNALVGNAMGAIETLRKAADGYRAIIPTLVKDENPMFWALLQSNMAATLEVLGEREKSIEILEESANVYRNVIEVIGRIEYPVEWAAIQMRLGLVLHRQGLRTTKTQTLKQSIEAFTAACDVFTREAFPYRYSEVQNHLGRVLSTLGEIMSGTTFLEQAVRCFIAALEARPKEQNPLAWAAVQNNLGTALFSLSKRTGNMQQLREASSCLRLALEVYTEANSAANIHIISKNLGRVDRLLESRAG